VNKDNMKLLKRYRLICKNKGLTPESIKAICDVDIPLFLRFIGNKHLEEVTHIDIEDFLEYCSENRKNAPITLNRKFSSLNSFFKTMIKKEYLNMRNPMDKLDKIKTRQKVRAYLTKEELRKIFDYIDKHQDLRGGALISLMYSSGCRLSEIHQLNRYDLDIEKRRFKVVGKGQKERLCIFSENVKERL